MFTKLKSHTFLDTANITIISILIISNIKDKKIKNPERKLYLYIQNAIRVISSIFNWRKFSRKPKFIQTNYQSNVKTKLRILKESEN